MKIDKINPPILKNISKAYVEGIYSDTPANRKLGRVGMSYADYHENLKDINDRAYFKFSEGKFSDKEEVGDWLFRKAGEKMILNPEETRELVKKFQKRYDFDTFLQAERILKGFAFQGTKKYNMSFDTNFGLYNFSIEVRNK